MTQLLKSLPPELLFPILVLVVVMWIIREIQRGASEGRKQDAAFMVAARFETTMLAEVRNICEALSRHVEESTKVQRELVGEMQLMRSQGEALRREMDDLKDEVRRQNDGHPPRPAS